MKMVERQLRSDTARSLDLAVARAKAYAAAKLERPTVIVPPPPPIVIPEPPIPHPVG